MVGRSVHKGVRLVVKSTFWKSGLRLVAAAATVMVLLVPQAAQAHKTAHHHRHGAKVTRVAAAPASRYASIIIDDTTGQVISAVNPDRRSYPASLTKMMTLYLLFDALEEGKLSLRSPLSVSHHATQQAPSKLALEVGDHIAVEDAILALVTKSANDVAVVVAEALGGHEEQFAQMMTAKAHALGMNGTVYRNASGLPNPGQVTTPRDQATLAHSLVHHHAKYYRYFSTEVFNWQGQSIPSHNRFMLNYEGADGIKTGYINASGFNLVASAVRGGHRLIGAVFGGNTAGWRDQRMAQLFDNAYARIEGGTVQALEDVEEAKPAPVPVVVAAPAPKVKKTQASDDEDPAGWAIQVGAFATQKQARHAAGQAARVLGAQLAHGDLGVDSVKAKKHLVYRARLTGFTAIQARTACSKMKRAGRECHIIKPEG